MDRMSAEHMLTTTRSVRKRLDVTKGVDIAVVETCIELALQAPSGSNVQAWHWMVVDDRSVIAQIATVYRECFAEYELEQQPQHPSGDPRNASATAVMSSARHLAEILHDMPVIVIPCQWGRLPESSDVAVQAGFWGSILPASWSFMLALRLHGLGTAWTSLHLRREAAVAEILGIPARRFTQACLFPVAHTIGTEFKSAPRVPLEQVVHRNRW